MGRPLLTIGDERSTAEVSSYISHIELNGRCAVSGTLQIEGALSHLIQSPRLETETSICKQIRRNGRSMHWGAAVVFEVNGLIWPTCPKMFGIATNPYLPSLSVEVNVLTGLSSAPSKRAQKSVAPPPLTTATRMTFGPFLRLRRLEMPSSITVWRSP
jgi:hypothetical protein